MSLNFMAVLVLPFSEFDSTNLSIHELDKRIAIFCVRVKRRNFHEQESKDKEKKAAHLKTLAF